MHTGTCVVVVVQFKHIVLAIADCQIFETTRHKDRLLHFADSADETLHGSHEALVGTAGHSLTDPTTTRENNVRRVETTLVVGNI